MTAAEQMRGYGAKAIWEKMTAEGVPQDQIEAALRELGLEETPQLQRSERLRDFDGEEEDDDPGGRRLSATCHTKVTDRASLWRALVALYESTDG